MAAGNPQPTASKHWLARNQQQTAEIDGVVLDFSRPGLDVRYVPVAYRSWGPPNTQTTQTADEAKRITQSVDIRTDAASRATNDFSVGQSPPSRQRIPAGSATSQPFTMYGPGGITYVGQIQFGVKVAVDDATRASLPAIFISSGNQWIPDKNGDGTFWYNPGVNLRVASQSSVGTGSATRFLSGWFSGDAYYFSSTGKINTSTGGLDEGSPATQWNPQIMSGSSVW